MIPVFTARIICSSALSEVPELVCCVTAGIHGGGSLNARFIYLGGGGLGGFIAYRGVGMSRSGVLLELNDDCERNFI